jgi:hypothetical protein
MRIGIAIAHSGFGVREELVARIRPSGHEVVDPVQTYLAAECSSAPRHLRRLGKVATLNSERRTA